MVSYVFPNSVSGTGNRADLATGDNVFVTFGATVASTDANGILGYGLNNKINIQGILSGNFNAIALLNNNTVESTHRIEIGVNAYVTGFSDGIYVSGSGGRINNQGTIWAPEHGIACNATNAGNPYLQTFIRNSGEIFGGSIGIRNYGGNGINVINSGTIETDGWAIYSDVEAIDKIVNTGTLNGGVYLGGGSDTYEGSAGHVSQSVFGGGGNDSITGGVDDESLRGDSGEDYIQGGNGSDTLDGGADDDYLLGDAGNDIIYGGSGNDTLVGGTGADYMAGQGGDDSMTVDHVGDRVIEAAGFGSDQVFSSISFALEAGQEIEFLTYSQATATPVAVTLTGNTFDQSITGGGGNDILNGSRGSDTLTGGAGNDTYFTDGGDTIVEGVNGGIDTVRSTATITLSANVEKLILAITGNGTGNTLANTMTGGAGANSLNGLAGNDVISGLGGNDRLFGGLGVDRLSGGTGADTFLFNTALAGGNIDTITDFRVVDDIIHLENSIFTGLGAAGVLSAAAFASNTTGFAGDASDRIIYETDTGRLYYDADGTGSAGRTQFALLTDGLALNRADFLII